MEQSPKDREHKDGRESNTDAAEKEPRTITPRIYVASLSDYNNGELHGAWIDAAQDVEELEETVERLLAESRQPYAEEFAIFDYEDFGPFRIHEYESLSNVARLAQGIAEHGVAFAHFASIVESTDEDRLRHFDEAYAGHYEDLAEYGETVIEGCGFTETLDEAVPELLAPYVRVDAEAFARDMEMGGMIGTSPGDGGIYVFDLAF
jgi:antirestriction protein